MSKKMSRRKFLKGFGAVSVLVAGGAVYRSIDQGVFSSGTGLAYEAWSNWRTDPADGPLRLVQSAILASNPHNTQPWLFHVTDNQISLFADRRRHLGAMDPYLREMTLGLGCALENMILTASATGYEANVSIVSGTLELASEQTEMTKVADIILSPAPIHSNTLYDAIPFRRTNRYTYDSSRSVDNSKLDEMTSLIDLDNIRLFTYRQQTPTFDTFVQHTVESTEAIIADEQMSHDNHRWVKQSWNAVQEDKDGVYIDTSGAPASTRTLVKMLPSVPRDQFKAGWLTSTQETLTTTDIVGFIAVRDLYDQEMTLNAGRIWQRLHLWGTTNGLAMQPINQMPEVVDRYRQLERTSRIAEIMDELTGDITWRPTFAFRMGYPQNNPLPSARRPVNEVTV